MLTGSDPRAEDWPQLMSQLGPTAYLGNTGFGYGDTASVDYSERWAALFAEFLNSEETVGEASLRSKRQYVLEKGAFGVYDEKVLAEATLYGFPMFRIRPQAPAAAAAAAARAADGRRADHGPAGKLVRRRPELPRAGRHRPRPRPSDRGRRARG